MNNPLSSTMYVKIAWCIQHTICPRCNHKAVYSDRVVITNIGYGEEFKVPQDHHCRKCGHDELDYIDLEE